MSPLVSHYIGIFIALIIGVGSAAKYSPMAGFIVFYALSLLVDIRFQLEKRT